MSGVTLMSGGAMNAKNKNDNVTATEPVPYPLPYEQTMQTAARIDPFFGPPLGAEEPREPICAGLPQPGQVLQRLFSRSCPTKLLCMPLKSSNIDCSR